MSDLILLPKEPSEAEVEAGVAAFYQTIDKPAASVGEVVKTILRAARAAAPVPWVRTSERLPTREDADFTGEVLACRARNKAWIQESLQYVTVENYDYWMTPPATPPVPGEGEPNE